MLVCINSFFDVVRANVIKISNLAITIRFFLNIRPKKIINIITFDFTLRHKCYFIRNL